MAKEIDDTNWRPDSESKVCECCGQRIRKPNRHVMDRAKYELLVQIARLNRQGHRWVKVQRDGRLISDAERESTIQCDAIHASRLYWFGLLERRTQRDGDYRVSDLGLAFLTGRGTVPSRIYCRQGVVEFISKARSYAKDIKRVILDRDFWNDYAATEQFESLPV